MAGEGRRAHRRGFVPSGQVLKFFSPALCALRLDGAAVVPAALLHRAVDVPTVRVFVFGIPHAQTLCAQLPGLGNGWVAHTDGVHSDPQPEYALAVCRRPTVALPSVARALFSGLHGYKCKKWHMGAPQK